MNIGNLLRQTFTYKYLYLPYRQKQAKERKAKQYEYLAEKGAEVFKSIVQIFKKEEIPYWLEFGTLLGAYRDKAFIKGDFDFDFGVNQKYAPRVYEAFTDAGFALVREFHEIGRNRIEQSYYNGYITFDILYFYEEEANVLMCYAFTPIPNKSVPNKVTYGIVTSWKFTKFDIMDYEFLGTVVSIPSNVEEHIEETYGKGWKIPDPNFGKGLNRHDYDVKEKMGVGFQYR